METLWIISFFFFISCFHISNSCLVFTCPVFSSLWLRPRHGRANVFFVVVTLVFARKVICQSAFISFRVFFVKVVLTLVKLGFGMVSIMVGRGRFLHLWYKTPIRFRYSICVRDSHGFRTFRLYICVKDLYGFGTFGLSICVKDLYGSGTWSSCEKIRGVFFVFFSPFLSFSYRDL